MLVICDHANKPGCLKYGGECPHRKAHHIEEVECWKYADTCWFDDSTAQLYKRIKCVPVSKSGRITLNDDTCRTIIEGYLDRR